MKIGILGSGMVAQALGEGFLRHGHDVMLGSREPAKLKEWAGKNAKAKTGSFGEAAKFGEVLVLAAKGSAAGEVLKLAGSAINGKPVIDTTNPIADNKPPVNGVLNYFTDINESLMERLQKAYPEAKLVKAFNQVGSALMVDPKLKDRGTMFI